MPTPTATDSARPPMQPGPRTFLVGGTPGSGKSTVCRLLMQRFAHGVHIPWDVIREQWVASGRELPWSADQVEAGRQMQLGGRAAFAVARVYAGAGFAVAIDGAVPPERSLLETVLAEVSDLDPVLIHLHPRLEVILQRVAERTGRDDVDLIRNSAPMHHGRLEQLRRDCPDLHFIDNSDLSPDQTVDAICAVAGMTPGSGGVRS